MPPLPLVPEEPPNRVAQRVTMDFSLLSVPLADLPGGSGNPKPAADQGLEGNQEEIAQVFSVTLCDCSAFSVLALSDLVELMTDCGFADVCATCPKSSSVSECPKSGSVCDFTNREAELTFTPSFLLTF